MSDDSCCSHTQGQLRHSRRVFGASATQGAKSSVDPELSRMFDDIHAAKPTSEHVRPPFPPFFPNDDDLDDLDDDDLDADDDDDLELDDLATDWTEQAKKAVNSESSSTEPFGDFTFSKPTPANPASVPDHHAPKPQEEDKSRVPTNVSMEVADAASRGDVAFLLRKCAALEATVATMKAREVK